MNIGCGKQNIAHVTKNNESDLATFFYPKIIKSSIIMDNVYANTGSWNHQYHTYGAVMQGVNIHICTIKQFTVLLFSLVWQHYKCLHPIIT